jgi:PEP-CTERM motif
MLQLFALSQAFAVTKSFHFDMRDRQRSCGRKGVIWVSGARRIRKMRKYLWIILLFASSAHADTVTVDLGPPQYISSTGQLDIAFSDLNGTPLDGESQTITILFSGGEYLYTPDGYDFDTGLVLQTNGSDCPGFASGTGTFLGADGTPLFAPIALGSAEGCGSSGELALGIEFPPLSGPYSAYGFQFDVTYPDDPGATIAAGDLLISFDNPWPEVFVEPLPEPPTFVLLSAGLGVLGLAGRLMRKRIALGQQRAC